MARNNQGAGARASAPQTQPTAEAVELGAGSEPQADPQNTTGAEPEPSTVGEQPTPEVPGTDLEAAANDSGSEPQADPEPAAATSPDAIVRPVTFPPAPHPNATHEVIRPIAGLPYEAGDKVDASRWRTSGRLEKLRYIRRLAVTTVKDAEQLNARLDGLVEENKTLKTRLETANTKIGELKDRLQKLDPEARKG